MRKKIYRSVLFCALLVILSGGWQIASAAEPPSPTSGKVGFSLSSPGGNDVRSEVSPRKGTNIKLSFPGANPHPCLELFNRLETYVSYFTGNDPAKWRSDVLTGRRNSRVNSIRTRCRLNSYSSHSDTVMNLFSELGHYAPRVVD